MLFVQAARELGMHSIGVTWGEGASHSLAPYFEIVVESLPELLVALETLGVGSYCSPPPPEPVGSWLDEPMADDQLSHQWRRPPGDGGAPAEPPRDGDERRARRALQSGAGGGASGGNGAGTGGGAGGGAACAVGGGGADWASAHGWDEWMRSWRSNVERWWAALALSDQSRIHSCLGAFGLSLASKLEALIRRHHGLSTVLPPEHAAKDPLGPLGAHKCEWDAQDFEAQLGGAEQLEGSNLPALPSFPELPDLKAFELPLALPRLLPGGLLPGGNLPQAREHTPAHPQLHTATTHGAVLRGAAAGASAGAALIMLGVWMRRARRRS